MVIPSNVKNFAESAHCTGDLEVLARSCRCRTNLVAPVSHVDSRRGRAGYRHILGADSSITELGEGAGGRHTLAALRRGRLSVPAPSGNSRLLIGASGVRSSF